MLYRLPRIQYFGDPKERFIMKRNVRYCFFLIVYCLTSLGLYAQCTSGRITFRVDMRLQTVSGSGVFFASEFQGLVGQTNWTATPMCDMGNGIWEITFCDVPAGQYQYKFLNGPGGWEFDVTGGPCTNPADNDNRFVTVSGGVDVEGPHCFETCDSPCTGFSDPGSNETVPPTIPNVPADITISCDDPVPTADCLPANDNCFINCSTELPIDDMSGLNTCGLGDIQRTWTVTDAYGNMSSASQIITVEDDEPPVIDHSTIIDVTVSCDAVPPAMALPAMDNCDPLSDTGLPTDDLSNVDACGVGFITRTWVVQDCGGLMDMHSQTITLVDNDPPVIDLTGINDITVSCGNVPPGLPLPASDNCISTLTMTDPPIDDISGLDACGLGVITRTWSVSGCQSATASIQITIEDNLVPIITDPIPADVTISCENPLPSALPLAANDLCDASVTSTTLPTDDISGLNTCGLGTLVRTWTATDCNGNMTTASQNITIEDNTAPVFTEIIPADIVIDCDQMVPVAFSLSASDACDASITFSDPPIDDFSQLNANGTGIIIRTWSVTDCSGNSELGTQTIQIDALIPSFNLQDIYCATETIPVNLPTFSDNGLEGTWNPSGFIPSALGAGVYSFEWTPIENCVEPYLLTITITGGDLPLFDTLSPYCKLDTNLYTLPTSSLNDIIGTWDIPSWRPTLVQWSDTVAVFTPSGGCSSPATLVIQIDTVTSLLWPDYTPFCSLSNDTIRLDTMSLNGVTGTWSPEYFVPSQVGMDSLKAFFMPDSTYCAERDSLTFYFDDRVSPTFMIGRPCKASTDTIWLPLMSTNGITGIWDIPYIIPAVETGNFANRSFTPTPGQCGSAVNLAIPFEDSEVPIFGTPTLCLPNRDTFFFDTSSSNGIVGTWQPAFVDLATTSAGNLRTLFTPMSGQCADTISMQVPIVNIPISYDGNTSACEGDTLRISGSVANAIAQKWEKDGLTVVGTGELFFNSIFPSDSGEFCFKAQLSTGCTVEDCLVIEVDQQASLSNAERECDTLLGTYTLTGIKPIEALVTVTHGTLSIDNDTVVTITGLHPDSIITLTITNGVCVSERILTRINCGCANPVTIQSITASNPSPCLGDAVQLNATVEPNTGDGMWTTINGGTLNTIDGSNATFSATLNGTYLIEYTVQDPDGSGPCEAAVDTIAITVQPNRPAPTLPTDSLIACKDSMFTVPQFGSNLGWIINNQTFNNPDLETTNLRDETWQVVDTLGKCPSDTATVQIIVEDCGCTVGPVDINILALNSTEVCQGDTISLTAGTNVGEGRWLDVNGFDLTYVTQTDLAIAVSFLESGVVTFYFEVDPDGMNANVCAPVRDSITITVFPTPDAPVLDVSSLSLCKDSVASPIQATGTFQSLLWQRNGNAIGGGPIIPNTDTIGIEIYSVTGISSDGCVSPATTLAIEVINCDTAAMPCMILPVSLVNSKDVVCQGDTILLTLAGGDDPSLALGSWMLSDPALGSLTTLDDRNQIFQASGTGMIDITYLGIDPDGDGPCTADTATIALEIQSLDAEASAGILDCFSDSTWISISGISSTAEISINPAPVDVQNDSIWVDQAGTYLVTILDGACEQSLATLIEDLAFSQEDVTIFEGLSVGEMITFIPSLSAEVVDAFVWSPALPVTDTTLIVTIPFAMETQYTVTMQVGSRCTADHTFILREKVGAPLEDYLPNIFSPNEDGANDHYRLPPGNPFVTIADIKVFDRWGDRVFAGSNLDTQAPLWNGKHNGRDVTPGVYIVYITALKTDGMVETAIKDVLVMR